MAEEKLEMTQDGLDKLEVEYRRLIDIERPDVIEQLKNARAQGDLSENADYDAARNRQAQIEARINQIEHIKDIAVVVAAPKAGKKASIGNVISYTEVATGEEMKVRIVGTVEADPMAEPIPLVSNESALGKALLGHAKGETVLVECDDPYEITILDAKNEKDK